MGEAADIGRRVQTLRTDAGYDLGAFAAAVGITPDDLSALEQGHREIGFDELAATAEALGVSRVAILDGDSLLARLPIASRVGSETASVRDARLRLVALAELHNTLGRSGHASAPALGDVPSDRDSGWLPRAKSLAEWASHRLARVASETVGRDHLSILATSIELHLGVDVMIESLGTDGPLGMSITDAEFPFILVNADVHGPRALFTLAHELGHVLARDGEAITIDSDLQGRSDAERLANTFASALLMPEEWIRRLINDHHRGASCLAQMLIEFGVSFEALIYRLHNLRIINEKGRGKLKRAGLQGLLRALEDGDEKRALLATRGDPARRSPSLLTERCYRGVWDGTISAAPLARLQGMDTKDLLARLRSH